MIARYIAYRNRYDGGAHVYDSLTGRKIMADSYAAADAKAARLNAIDRGHAPPINPDAGSTRYARDWR